MGAQPDQDAMPVLSLSKGTRPYDRHYQDAMPVLSLSKGTRPYDRHYQDAMNRAPTIVIPGQALRRYDVSLEIVA